MFQTQKGKIVLLTFLTILVFFLGLLLINAYSQQKRSYYLQIQSTLLLNKYTVLHKYLKIMSHDIYTMYEQKPHLIELLSKAVEESPAERNATRKAVYKLLIRNYKRLEHMGISQVHFHLPDNHSFLRMYAPEQFGDDLTPLRKSVVLANKLLKPIEGMEACPYLLGYRFVYPLFNAKKEHIGSVEISYSSEIIFKNLIEDFTYDHHLLISKSVANNTIVGHQYGYNYKETWESPDYYIEEQSHKKLKDKAFYKQLATPSLQNQLAQKFQTQEPFALAVGYNYQQIVLNFLPIPSADGIKNIAYIVTYKVSPYLSRVDVQQTYITLLFSAVLLLLYIFSIYVIINREKLKELALYDPLTTLPNRTLFTIEFEDEIKRAKRYNYKLALMFIDLDGFKAVNDTFGHHVGDELLKEVARVIKTSIRQVDLAARLSGDEFTIVLSHAKDTKEATKVAMSILKKINETITIQNNKIKVGASIGIALFPDDASSMQQLLLKADRAMYRAKENGKNQVFCYSMEKN